MSKASIDMLFKAIMNNDGEKVKNIVNNMKVDINCVDANSGMTPLLRSIYQESPKLVEVCINLGANINQQGKVEDNVTTPLMRSVFQRNKEIVNILLKSPGIKTDYKVTIDSVDYTLHERAMYQEDYDIAALLLSGESYLANDASLT